MKRIRLLVAACVVIAGLSGLVPAIVSADTAKETVCAALDAGNDCTKNPTGSVNINSVIATVINILSFVTAVVAVVMIIVAGFRYITAAGDSSKLTGAKNTLIYAIIGLVIVALAQTIVKFVLEGLQAPNCPAGQTVDHKTNKCVVVKKKTALGPSTYYHITVDKYYTLNYRAS